MNENVVQAETGSPATGQEGYRLSDDLAQLCLPSEFKDSYRNLGWVNSICFLFLVVGLIGLRAPRVIKKAVVEVPENPPIALLPPEERPQPKPEIQPDEPQPQDTPVETPQVVAVVAAADSSQVAFAVPVEGATAVAPVRFATPPPPPNYKPTAPAKFDPNASDGGSYPAPQYPVVALRGHHEGTSVVDIVVGASGEVTSVKLQKSSGFSELDDAAVEVVKRRWRFLPGPERYYYWACTFKME